MAKRIKNPIELKLVFNQEDGNWELDPSVHYGVGADEYPQFNHRKGMPVELTQQQKDAVIQMVANVVYPQILANEEI